MLSLSNRCVTASGIIFHSVSSSPQWPCMSMAWPSTPPLSMTTEPSRTLPPARGCSSAPAGVNSSSRNLHFYSSLMLGFDINECKHRARHPVFYSFSLACGGGGLMIRAAILHYNKVASWHIWHEHQQLQQHKAPGDNQLRRFPFRSPVPVTNNVVDTVCL